MNGRLRAQDDEEEEEEQNDDENDDENEGENSLTLKQMSDLAKAQGFASKLCKLWCEEACPPETFCFLTLGYCNPCAFAFLRHSKNASFAETMALGKKEVQGNNEMADNRPISALIDEFYERDNQEDNDLNPDEMKQRASSFEKCRALLDSFHPKLLYAEGNGDNCDMMVDAIYFFVGEAIGGKNENAKKQHHLSFPSRFVLIQAMVE